MFLCWFCSYLLDCTFKDAPCSELKALTGERRERKRHPRGRCNHLVKFSGVRNKETVYLQTGPAEGTAGVEHSPAGRAPQRGKAAQEQQRALSRRWRWCTETHTKLKVMSHILIFHYLGYCSFKREKFGKFSTPHCSCTPLLKLERGSWLLQPRAPRLPPPFP